MDAFKVAEVIKGGGFGIVYICEVISEPCARVAIKSFKDKYFEREEVIEDFYHEAEVWVKLGEHRNIVRAHLVVSIAGKPHIVLEYVNGGSLRDQLVGRRLSIHETLKFGTQFCHGIIYANSKDLGEGKRGVVHRDIKPANIMLTKEGLLKITDFGLVKALGAPRAERPAGTPEYMSPEQFRTMDVDQRSDIYSFGVALYEMLTSRLPFYIQTEDNIERWYYCEHHHQEELPKPPSQIDSSTSPALERVVLKCLKKSPKDRYQSFEELEKEFKQIYQNQARIKSEE